MKRNKKFISLAVVFAMIITVFSSLIVVNAAGASAYATAEKTDTGVTLTIGYKDMTEELSGFELTVPIPEGYTATADDITLKLTGGMNSANVTPDNEIFITFVGANYAATAEVATVNLTLTAATPAEEYEFAPTIFNATLANAGTDVTIEDGTVTAEKSTVEYEAAPVTGPRVIVSDAVAADGKVVITISYADMLEELSGFELTVPIPEGYTATADDISLKLTGGMNSANVTPDNEIFITFVGANYAATADVAEVTLTVGENAKDVKMAATIFNGTLANAGTDVTMEDGSVGAVKGSISLKPVPDEAKVTGIEITPETATVAPGEKVTFTVKVSGTGDFNDKYTITATAGEVDGDVVTVPADAKDGDTITVTAKADGDETITDTATITVKVSSDPTPTPAPEENPVVEATSTPVEVTGADGKKTSINMFSPKIAADKQAELVEALKANGGADYATATYRVVFDFVSSSDNTVGWALVNLTGAELEAVITGADGARAITATATGASKTKIHFEDSKGNIIK